MLFTDEKLEIWNGVKLKRTNLDFRWSIHEGNNAVLLIATTYEEDTGTFTCRATTTAGTVETSAKLIVKSKNWIKDTNSIANTIRDWIDGISL